MLLRHKYQCSMNQIVFQFSSHIFFVQIGSGEIPDETTLVCSRGSDRFGAHIPF